MPSVLKLLVNNKKRFHDYIGVDIYSFRPVSGSFDRKNKNKKTIEDFEKPHAGPSTVPSRGEYGSTYKDETFGPVLYSSRKIKFAHTQTELEKTTSEKRAIQKLRRAQQR